MIGSTSYNHGLIGGSPKSTLKSSKSSKLFEAKSPIKGYIDISTRFNGLGGCKWLFSKCFILLYVIYDCKKLLKSRNLTLFNLIFLW